MIKRKVINLLRVSTDAQDLARQRTDVRLVATAHGLEVLRTLEVDGVSGRHVQQDPQFQAIFRDLQRPDVAGVSISALDRLFRPEQYGDFGILDHFRANRKLIFSAKEGVLDPATDAGFLMSLMSGAQAGMEWRELRRRTMQGKEELRRQGRHVDGPNCLPRGVAYDKATGKHSYQEPDCSRVARMYPLLLAGDSYRTIADRVGGSWSHDGVRSTLRHPIWAFGTRVYHSDERREEGYTVKVIDEPLVSVATWEAAQREMDRRKTNWRKTRRPPRFLASGLLRCACGKPYYLRCASKKDCTRKKDYYYCSSAFPGYGPKCGARSCQREQLEAALEQLVSENLCQEAVLRAILAAVAGRDPRADGSGKAEREITRLEAKRARVIDLRADGLISREECGKRLAVVDSELQAARAAARPPAPVMDMHALARGLAGAFALFASLPFAQKRDLLRRAVRDIVIDNGNIPSMTLRGGFLAEILGYNTGANLSAHSTWRSWRQRPARWKPPRWS
jgi:DNA invertase Pin-like site-specific DNA recombinase